MRPMSRILTLLLAQVGGDLGRGLGEWIGEHCEDPGQALPGAVQRAQGASWEVLELALAGDSLGKRFRVALGAAQVKGVLAPVEQLLQAQGPHLRERCLSELRQARDAGLLGADLNFDLLQRLWQGQEQGLDALRDGLTLERLGAARGAVTPGLSCSLHGETGRQLMRARIVRYRALPARQQRARRRLALQDHRLRPGPGAGGAYGGPLGVGRVSDA